MPNLKRLWGDYFINPKTKEQSNVLKPGMVRTFCYFFVKPIRTIYELAMSDNESDKKKLDTLISKLNIK